MTEEQDIQIIDFNQDQVKKKAKKKGKKKAKTGKFVMFALTVS